MDDLDRYREIVKMLITEYAVYQPAQGEIEVETIFDESNDHYELMCSGWNGPYRIHGSVLHIDIREGKVWIQHDGTEEGVAEKLVEAGIPRERIVLAYKPHEIRPYMDFAIS
ncbi:MAG: XisI protein [Chloroflexi bacterium]|nr:XisI protein [Chloroflexota bacterium]MCI0565067.1 XisI protein [Nitrososphaera sp.]MCI0645665.1 XisI protein [Chloroflexota bacterium]MCI0725577.1 XisI protein [Chloroflexota bacterium]